jgi:ubiquinone biosynthesis protein UbiJ
LEEKEIDPAWDLAAIYQAIAAERIANARRRSSEWVEPRLKLAIAIATSDRVICDALERELSAPPTFLAVEARQQVGDLLESIRTRIASLDEQIRQSVVAKWQERFLPLTDVGKLERRETEELLHSLRNPPCKLTSEEVKNVNSAVDQLTVRLDELSVDEIVNRIRRLSVARQKEIQVQLFSILESEQPSAGNSISLTP